MPLYEYYCKDCHGVFELLRPPREASDAQPCPECDSDAPRIVSNFEAFTFRDGYPRKLPDDGSYWHLGQKVSAPITGAVEANEHPELVGKKRRPPQPPTVEELEAHNLLGSEYMQRRRDQKEAGLGEGAIEAQVERQLRQFSKRVRQTAGQAKLKRRRKPNAETTPRTASGQHTRGKSKRK